MPVSLVYMYIHRKLQCTVYTCVFNTYMNMLVCNVPVCVCVYVCVCICQCMCIYMYLYVYVCECVCVSMCTCVCICLCIYRLERNIYWLSHWILQESGWHVLVLMVVYILSLSSL